jgi:hypothetical protein
VVYTWVNGSNLAGNQANGTLKRWRENDELKFSLRSLEKFMPWVSKIYIVTNGERPEWLKKGHPKISVVSHTQIYKNKRDLPTYNSVSIEFNIHRIPGLSNQFIYFNDDMLLNDHVNVSDFWTRTGGYKLPFSYPAPNCNHNCPYESIGDGLCDLPCFVDSCALDMTDCISGTLQPPDNDCPTTMIHDGICQPQCNTANHGYDGSDCPLVFDQIKKLVLHIKQEHSTLNLAYDITFLIVTVPHFFGTEMGLQVKVDKPHLVRKIIPVREDGGPHIVYFYILFYRTKDIMLFTFTSPTKEATVKLQFFIPEFTGLDDYAASLVRTNILLGNTLKHKYARPVIQHSVISNFSLTYSRS